MGQQWGGEGVLAIAEAVRSRQVTAVDVVGDTISRMAADEFNAVSDICAERALRDAEGLDRKIRAGNDVGPLAGVPFGVKNLFNVEGIVTLAGSKIHADNPPASSDASVVGVMTKAGAIVVGALHMDEYAFGFTNENGHYGACLNPHDRSRVSGGSSGGSAAAVAGNLLPTALGTDTNGSIRIPAALCGIFGLKPTVGRISLEGGVLFAKTLDTAGPFARSAGDLSAVYYALSPSDRGSPARTPGAFRAALAGGYYQRDGEPEALRGAAEVARALGDGDQVRTIDLPEPEASRASAFAITACEGAAYHHERLVTRAADIAPFARHRLMAGAMFPAHWYLKAQKFRSWLRERTAEAMERSAVDLVIAPATPCVAPGLDEEMLCVAGTTVPKRSILGLYTQPLAPLGFPILTVPVHGRAGMPLGVQIMGRPGTENLLLQAGEFLEAAGIAVPRTCRQNDTDLRRWQEETSHARF